MPNSNTTPPAMPFENMLTELEQIVAQLESGELPLEAALTLFERGVQLAKQGQLQLQQAEQRVHILLNDDPEGPLTPFDGAISTTES